MCQETEVISESKKKRLCEFDWTEELTTDVSSEDERSSLGDMPPLEPEEEYLKRKAKWLREDEEEQQQLLK